MFTSPGRYWIVEQGGNGASLSLGECDSPEELTAALDQVKAQGGDWDNWVVHGPPAVPVIPTGNAALNRALGIGGIPQGRLTTITGDSGRGHQLARAIVAQAQQIGHVACWVDCAGSLDLRELREAGVDCTRLYITQPPEKAALLDILRALVLYRELGLVVVDQPPTTHASWARGLLSMAQDTKTTLVFLDADGVAAFHASIRLQAEHDSILVVKNKYAPPYQRVPLGNSADIPATTQNPDGVRPRPLDVEITNH